MTDGDAPAALRTARARRYDGWLEAGLFALALSVLNVSYGLGHQQGAHPVAFLIYAMPIAALSLLVISGPGPDWRQIMTHPLSLAVGSGIIAMEAVYYVLLTLVTPTDGSILVRLGVPAALLTGVLLGRGRPTWLAIAGALIIVAAVGWFVPHMQTAAPWTALALGGGCAVIMTLRSFAAEYHPWNRRARTIVEKMRVTGLMLLITSVIGGGLVLATVAAAAHGLMTAPRWLPGVADLTHTPTLALGVFVGMAVLTAMQYLGFSVVVKIGTESFIATTALIPVVTLVVQEAAIRAGVLAPMAFDARGLVPMAAVIVGVALVIAGGRPRP